MKRMSIFIAMLVLCSGWIAAQTEQVTVAWDPNPEPDIARYVIQRAVNGGIFFDYREVVHPTVSLVDEDVVPGGHYAYRAAAVNSAGLQSHWSPVAEAGIPLIDLQLSHVSSSQDTIIELGSFLVDPDGSGSELQLTISDEFNVQVSREAGQLRLTPPPGYVGEAAFRLNAADASGFFDEQEIRFNYIVLKRTTSVAVDIPPLQLNEDDSLFIRLDDHVTVTPYAPSELLWHFSGGGNLRYMFRADDRSLKIEAQAENWFGRDTFQATATAPDFTLASATVTVDILPVNDPPQLNLSVLTISTLSENRFDMTLYADDVDHRADQLEWEFAGFQQFAFDWADPTGTILSITPLPGATVETGRFTVRDPDGGAATRDVTIYYSEHNTPPHLYFNERIVIAEDSIRVIDLQAHVVDSTHTFQELSWGFKADSHIALVYDKNGGTLTLQPQPDWSGETALGITVQDPLGAEDEALVSMVVQPQNSIGDLMVLPGKLGDMQVRFVTELSSQSAIRYWREKEDPVILSQQEWRTRHDFLLSDLQPRSLYFIEITAVDERGRSASRADSFKTGHYRQVESVDLAAETVVYPNPVKTESGHREMIFLNLPEGAAEVVFYSIVGKKVQETVIPDGGRDFRIDMMSNRAVMPSGVYVYLIRNEHSQVLRQDRIVVIR